MPLLRFEAYHVRDQSAAQCNGRPVWAVPGTPELTGASYAFAKAFVNATTFPLPIQRATWGELELVRQRASRDQVCVLLTQGATKRC